MLLLSPKHWKDYELIDSGGFEKLERFGEYTLIRPEPQAIWNKLLAKEEWEQMAHARFTRDSAKQRDRNAKEDGWTHLRKTNERWNISYEHAGMKLKLQLAFTSFGHIGVFPEQAENWDFIHDTIRSWKTPGQVLNMFAYTGGASLAARAAGSEVTHVDAVKNMVSWANTNQQISGLNDIRWVVEDALKFVKREVKRGKTYQGIILDPPAYGRGPAGEKWVLEEGLPELITLCGQLLAPTQSFLVLNLYSMGLSPLVSANLAQAAFSPKDMQFGEFFIPSRTGQRLPLGTFLRFIRP